jgi:hypothetical protein
MKTIIVVLVFLVSDNFVMAQPESHVAVYWVVETNVYQKDFTILKFYNGQDQVIHEVTLDRSFLDISKERHKRKVEALFKKYSSGLSSSKKNKQRKSI